MPELASESTILVVPVAPCSASDATRLINKLRESKTEFDTALAAPEEGLPHLFIPWNIQNKYYTADVQFCIVEADTTNLEAIPAVTGGGEPAVVVLASSQETPSDSLRGLLESLAERIPEFDVSLLLTIPPSCPSTTSADAFNLTSKSLSTSESTTTVNEEAWDDLALDNGFEWIDLSDAKDGEDSTGREEEMEMDHDDGIGRIRDALESHMWEGMVRVTKKEAQLAQGSSGSRAQKGQGDDYENGYYDEEEELRSMGVPPLPQPRPFIPTKLEFPSTFLPSIPRNSTATSPSSISAPRAAPSGPVEAEQDSFDDDFSPFVQASSSSTSASFSTSFPSLMETRSSLSPPDKPSQTKNWKNGLQDGEFEGEEEEEDLESLDNLFEQIRLAREVVIAQEEGVKGEMDEETLLRRRRERAEKLLEQVLGAGGF